MGTISAKAAISKLDGIVWHALATPKMSRECAVPWLAEHSSVGRKEQGALISLTFDIAQQPLTPHDYICA